MNRQELVGENYNRVKKGETNNKENRNQVAPRKQKKKKLQKGEQNLLVDFTKKIFRLNYKRMI